MRKSQLLLPEVKRQILLLKNKSISLTVNSGRKRITTYRGTLIGVYPAVFTVKPDEPTTTEVMSYSYSDILCGNVRLKETNAV